MPTGTATGRTAAGVRHTVAMVPILGGLGAAIAFTFSILFSARASRLIGAPSTLAGAMTVGLAIALPIALVTSPAPDLPPATLGWAGLSGLGNVLGLFLTYTAYRVGTVGVVSTIASTEGAIAAVIAVVAGEVLAPGSGPALGVIAIGVVLAATGGGNEEEEGIVIPRDRSIRAAALAIGAAFSFGIGLYASGRVSELLPAAWAILPARIVGVAVVAIPLAAFRRVRITRQAWPYVLGVAIAELVGYVSYVIGARESIAIAAVLTSMFAPLATIAAFVLFRERLGRRQVLGIVLVVAGVTVLGLLQA